MKTSETRASVSGGVSTSAKTWVGRIASVGLMITSAKTSVTRHGPPSAQIGIDPTHHVVT